MTQLMERGNEQYQAPVTPTRPTPPRPQTAGKPGYFKSVVLMRINAGREVTRQEAETELHRLNDLLVQVRRKKLTLTDDERKRLCDDQRRLEAYNELIRVAVREERAQKRDQRFKDVLGIGLAAVDDPAVMLGCVLHVLKWKVSQRDLEADEDMKTVVEAAEMCLTAANKRANQAARGESR